MRSKNMLIWLVDIIPLSVRTKIKNIPVLKQLQAFLLRTLSPNKEFVAIISGGPAKGLSFPVQLPQDKLMWIGTWELDFAKALSENIKPGWVCYDIGGYKGYYSGIMALKGAKEVHVFEPMPSNVTKIKELINLNKPLPIQLHEMAISDNAGTDVFKIMKEETMGKLQSSNFQQEEKGVKVVVCVNSLDELIKSGLPEPDFIKIDVEGAEEKVLMGALNLLHRKKPFLMIEVHSPEIGVKCLEILKRFYKNISITDTQQMPGMESGIVNYSMKD